MFAFGFVAEREKETIKKLAEQIMAYNAEEKIAVDKISSLSGIVQKRTILIDLKSEAEKKCGIRPTMVESFAKKYL